MVSDRHDGLERAWCYTAKRARAARSARVKAIVGSNSDGVESPPELGTFRVSWYIGTPPVTKLLTSFNYVSLSDNV
eukprot:5337003-Heterocapsa_arctica.AAC.2